MFREVRSAKYDGFDDGSLHQSIAASLAYSNYHTSGDLRHYNYLAFVSS